MAAADKSSRDNTPSELRLGSLGTRVFIQAGVVGGVFLGLSLMIGLGAEDGGRQFMHSYLVAYMWTLSVALGALWWVTLQHLVNARWSIAVRRVGELLAANMPVLIALSLPIVIPTLFGSSTLYVWADAAHMQAEHALHHKAAYLNTGFFGVRLVLYFTVWTVLGRYFLRRSLDQDLGAGADIVGRLRVVSAPAMIAFALTLTFAAIDLLMSLDPMWFSTIFGVYYFAGCVVSVHAVFALVLVWLQRRGRLVRAVTTEHFHDIGKMLFAFIIFWAYIAFSQFMLIWYANLPEETEWYRLRVEGPWRLVAWALVLGHFAVPFVGLMSRHVKRHRGALAFWAVWMLALHWLDLYWLVMPALSREHLPLGLLDLTCWLGVFGLFIASTAYHARNVNLVPTRDPRLAESLAFENV